MLDALVFFTVAMLICSLQIAQLRRELDSARDMGNDERCDPSAVLSTLLRSSIGRAITIDAEAQLKIRCETTVAECLSFEAIALMDGFDTAAFEDLNGVIHALVCAVTAPVATPHIVMEARGDVARDTLLVLEARPPTAEDCYAASQGLAAVQNKEVYVTLSLEPALLPEALGV